MSRLSGGCLCGAVRYRTNAAPLRVSLCHCRMCQRNTGSAFGPYATFRTEDLVWEKGAPKQFRSSRVAQRGFCAECGSPLTFQFDRAPERLSVTLGSLDRPEAVGPALALWTANMLPWAAHVAALPARPRAEDVDF